MGGRPRGRILASPRHAACHDFARAARAVADAIPRVARARRAADAEGHLRDRRHPLGRVLLRAAARGPRGPRGKKPPPPLNAHRPHPAPPTLGRACIPQQAPLPTPEEVLAALRRDGAAAEGGGGGDALDAAAAALTLLWFALAVGTLLARPRPPPEAATAAKPP